MCAFQNESKHLGSLVRLRSLLMLNVDCSSLDTRFFSFSLSLSVSLPSVLPGCHYAMCHAHTCSPIRCERANLL